jgi:hypothetical protein
MLAFVLCLTLGPSQAPETFTPSLTLLDSMLSSLRVGG